MYLVILLWFDFEVELLLESKYEPLGHDESFKIMEEILAMQVGIGMEGVSQT